MEKRGVKYSRLLLLLFIIMVLIVILAYFKKISVKKPEINTPVKLAVATCG